MGVGPERADGDLGLDSRRGGCGMGAGLGSVVPAKVRSALSCWQRPLKLRLGCSQMVCLLLLAPNFISYAVGVVENLFHLR